MYFKDIAYLQPRPLAPGALGRDVADVFQTNPHLTLCPIADVDGDLIGCVPRNQFLRMLTGPFGRALYDKKPAAHFISGSVQVSYLGDSLKDLLAGIDLDRSDVLRDGIALVDRANRYVGVLPGLRILSEMHRLHSQMVSELQTEVQDRKAAEDRVRQLANTDPLTGVLNRRAFRNAMDEMVPNASSIGCAYIDLDGFKQLNDRFGHAVGDRVLVSVAHRLERLTDATFVARLGGDEFVIMAIDTRPDDFAALCQKALDHICEPEMTEAGPVRVNASIGWSMLPDDAACVGSLLEQADQAMLQVKSIGGGVLRHRPNRSAAQVA